MNSIGQLDQSSRRSFLTRSGLGVISTACFNPVASKAAGKTATSGTHRVRNDIATLSERDPNVIAYKKAIVAMRALPASDPRNWNKQANIHQDYCPHGNWFFLPWHRAYLVHFEQICRKLSGYDDFTLPYWNWTRDPQIPAVFWGDNNPLNHTRDAGPNDTIRPEFVGQTVIDEILALKDFELFASKKSTAPRGAGGGSSRLESTPHNTIHRFIGGDMGDLLSPLDPIFWLHHANVDRLWARWNGLGNPNTSDVVWTGYMFKQNFVDSAGKPVNDVVGKLISTYDLDYRYDDQKPAPAVPSFTSRLFNDIDSLTLVAVNHESTRSGQPVAVWFSVSPEFTSAARLATQEVVNMHNTIPQRTVRLSIGDVTPPKNKRSFVRVFVNCGYLTEQTPINDPHYVATFSFFGGDHGGSDHHGGAEYVFDLTKTLEKLDRSKQFPLEKIAVQLLAVPLSPQSPEVELLAGKIQIAVATTGE